MARQNFEQNEAQGGRSTKATHQHTCICVPVSSQVVQTGSDVISVEVHLLTVEAALSLQAAKSLTKLLELRPPPLAVQTLLTDVLEDKSDIEVKTCVTTIS